MSIVNISEDTFNEIKKHILFFISEERLYTSTLYEMIKISPGNWFDIEEFAYRTSVKKLCKDLKVIREIVKYIDEIEYNDLTGQVRVKNLTIIDDIVNERTVIFYSLKLEFDEENLVNIITENNLTKLIVRFLKGGQLRYRRDLKPLYPIVRNKIGYDSDVVILKMSTRMEAVKIKKIINFRYPETNSLLAITNFFSNGCLSINLSLENDGTSEVHHKSNSIELDSISGGQLFRDGSLIVSKYTYRANEYPIILDYLIENDLKPIIFRNFVECRVRQHDMYKIRHYISISPCYIGCFSILTYDSIDEVRKAVKLIKSILPYLDVIEICDGEPVEHSFFNSKSRYVPVKKFVSSKSTSSSISENQVSINYGSYESLENVENNPDKDEFNNIKIDNILKESLENVENNPDKDEINNTKIDQISNDMELKESLENVENILDKDEINNTKIDQISNDRELKESLENVENIPDKDEINNVKIDQISNDSGLKELENIEQKIEPDVFIDDNVHNSYELESRSEMYINSLVSDECPASSVCNTTNTNVCIPPSNVNFNDKSKKYIGRGFSSNNYYENSRIQHNSKQKKSTRKGKMDRINNGHQNVCVNKNLDVNNT